MAVETAPTPAMATSKQQDTIARLERATGVPKAQRKDATMMTRQQASEYITALISRTQVDDEDDTPAPAQVTPSVGPILPASQVGPQQFAETKAAMQQLPGTRNETPQGEWPPVPARSSDAPQARQKEVLVPQVSITPPQASRPVPSDNPFESDGDDDLDLRLGGEEDDDEIDLMRQKDAPEGGPFAFQIISADSVPAGPSGYKGIRIRARGLPATPEAEGGTVEDLLSLSPKARFRLDPFLDAIRAPESGSIKRSSFAGKTFWATTKRETRTWQDSTSGEERSAISTRVKEYLTGPPIEAPKLNGAAPRQKVQATLGSEFDTDKVPF